MKKIISILLILVIFITACSSGSSDITYKTDSGEVSYKSNPKIYADWFIGELLYLDANVVAADLTYPGLSWADIAKERNVKNISNNMEAIAVEKPDLIITIQADSVDQFKQIAPTVYLDYSANSNPEELIKKLGTIVGNEKKADDFLKTFNKNVDELKKSIDKPEYAVGIADSWGGSNYMYGANFGRGGYILYNKLSLKGTEAAENDYIRKDSSYVSVDGENIIKYAGDVLYIAQTSDNGTSENPNESSEAIKALPTYNDLEAVKNDRVYVLDGKFTYNDPYSLEYQIEKLKEIYSNEDL